MGPTHQVDGLEHILRAEVEIEEPPALEPELSDTSSTLSFLRFPTPTASSQLNEI